ncbi:hypothetical protein EIM50_21820, partial [Pseudoxanthomonas sp. SGD-10]
MKTKQMLVAGIMGMLFPFFAHAQQSVDPDLLGKFSPSTINRLYGVASKIDLPKEKQWLLAKLYQREDSLVTQALLKKSPQVMIDEIYVSTSRQQLKIFNEKELMQWKQYQNGQIKQPEAEQTYIKNKLAEIRKIRSLTPKEALTIEAGFLSICSKRNDSFDANLQEVLPGIIKDTAVISYVFKEVITEKAKKATLKYPLEHDVPAILLNYSYDLIYALNKEQETLRIAHLTDPQVRDKQIEAVKTLYQVKIDSVLMRNGYKLPKTQFANAIKFKQELKLKEEQL